MKRKISMYSLIAVVIISHLVGCQKDDVELIAEKIPNQKDSILVENDSALINKDSVYLTIETSIEDTTVSYNVTSTVAYVNTLFVATNGSDNNPGTIDKPLKTISKAISLVKPGYTIFLRGGKYLFYSQNGNGLVIQNKSGMAGNLIKLWAYPGEKPILSFENVTSTGSIKGIKFTGDYWHFKGLSITNVMQTRGSNYTTNYSNSFQATNSNNNIFENLDIYKNQGMGFVLNGNSNNNLILNCDFHDNYDPYSYKSDGRLYDGGNADGITIRTEYKNVKNKVQGCRMWYNSDDGLDLWQNEGIVVIEKCWAFKNGYLPGTTTPKGDGNGFKLGRTSLIPDATPQRIIKNCLAFENKADGFDQNNANVIVAAYNNTAFNNKGTGFQFVSYKNKNIFHNNISYGNASSQYRINAESTMSNNSWNYSMTNNDFQNLSSSMVTAQRNADGSLPVINYLYPKTSSVLIDKGKIISGISYFGNAPDIGAFEVK